MLYKLINESLFKIIFFKNSISLLLDSLYSKNFDES